MILFVETSPALLPLLRSDLQGRLLAALLLQPGREKNLSELVRELGSSIAVVHREVQRLVDFGLLNERRSGRNRYVAANTAHPLFEPIARMIEFAYGPTAALSSALGSVDGIDEAAIFGSWAARASGEAGPPANDIDVIVVGRPDRGQLADAVETAERRLRQEVNVRVVDRDRWESSDEPFLQAVRSRPLTRLELAS